MQERCRFRRCWIDPRSSFLSPTDDVRLLTFALLSSTAFSLLFIDPRRALAPTIAWRERHKLLICEQATRQTRRFAWDIVEKMFGPVVTGTKGMRGRDGVYGWDGVGPAPSWDRARPRALASCLSDARRRPGTAALPGRPMPPWDRARPRAHAPCLSHALPSRPMPTHGGGIRPVPLNDPGRTQRRRRRSLCRSCRPRMRSPRTGGRSRSMSRAWHSRRRATSPSTTPGPSGDQTP